MKRARRAEAAMAHDELTDFLRQHPDTRFVDAVFVDLCGIVRGKRAPRSECRKIFDDGMQIPYSIYLLDVTGSNSDPCGRGFSDGDPDGTAVPLAATLAPQPWLQTPGAQVLMTMLDGNGCPYPFEPRNVAAAVVERFTRDGLRPVVAFELEFYLFDTAADVSGAPRPPLPPGSARRDDATQVYGMDELDRYGAFFRDVEEACAAQQVPASVASAEFAPAQYEINLRHVDDPLRAADHCALLRHVVKQVARRHGMSASFLSKPFTALTGSGMHLHLSLLDRDGANLFDDDCGSGAALRHCLGGLMDTMFDGFGIFAPNVNGYRRFRPNSFVPVARSWGRNNRSVAFRIPAGDGAARRIEHRVAGADANPYLVLAAVLAAMHHGLERALDPGAPSAGNAGESVDPELPRELGTALDVLQRSPVLGAYLGREYLELYCAIKRNELRAFGERISGLEYQWYL